MSLPISIERLLIHGDVEQSRIEYKAGWDPEPIVHSICAFANDYEGYCGGYVIIGVEARNGIPVLPVRGIEKEKLDDIQNEIVEYCRKCISPAYIPTIEPMEFRGANIIVLWCPNGYDLPYYAKEEVYAKGAKSEKCYIRKGSVTLAAKPNEIKELQRSADVVPFDDRPCRKAEVSDLRPSLVMEYLSDIESDLLSSYEERGNIGVYESLGLLSGPQEALRPKNVAILMFTDDPSRFIPEATIVVDYVPDPTGEGLQTATFKGPLFRQIKDALQYIKNLYIRTMIHKIDGQAESVSIENFPHGALEEILPNAVLHKDYQIPEPVTVRITNDRLEVTSFPGITQSISDERISKLDLISRSYRNRRIASFLRDLDLIEAKNTGIPKAVRALARNGSPNLRFEMGPDREYVTVIIEAHPDFLVESRQVPIPQSSSGSLRERILSFLTANPMSGVTEICKGLGYDSVPRSVRLSLEKMCERGEIKRVGKKYIIG